VVYFGTASGSQFCRLRDEQEIFGTLSILGDIQRMRYIFMTSYREVPISIHYSTAKYERIVTNFDHKIELWKISFAKGM
jgi:hypothetical protein